MPARRAISRELDDLTYAGLLTEHEGPLERSAQYELTHLRGLDLEDVRAAGSRFLECAFTDDVLSAGSLKRSRFSDVWLRRVRMVDVDLSESMLHDVTLLDSALAAVEAYGGELRRVVFSACKLDSVNFRETRFDDVEFDGCVLRNVDLSGASLKNVRFGGSTVEGLELDGATLTTVDFSTARELSLGSGVRSLKGATISMGQLMALAPMMASSLGITLRD